VNWRYGFDEKEFIGCPHLIRNKGFMPGVHRRLFVSAARTPPPFNGALNGYGDIVSSIDFR